MTVVIATYNRPQLLEVAIQSVLRQTLESWQLLVIGDDCDQRTAELMDMHITPRIRYLNLPKRFGEQAGPNSIGIRLSDTPFIALLNHDDVWLPDHLEAAIRAIERTSAQFYLSRSASADSDRIDQRPRFIECNSPDRRLSDVFLHSVRWFEPASTFVFSRAAANTLGDWPSSTRCHRVPIQVWLLRLWRSGLPVHFGGSITVIRGTAYPPKKSGLNIYDATSTQHPVYLSLILKNSADDIRSMIATDNPRAHRLEDLKLRSHSKNVSSRMLFTLLMNPLTGGIFYLTGNDAYDVYCRLTGQRAGKRMRKTSIRRVGRNDIADHDIEEVISLIENRHEHP